MFIYSFMLNRLFCFPRCILLSYIINFILFSFHRVQKKHWIWASLDQRGLKSAGLKRCNNLDYPISHSVKMTNIDSLMK